MKKTKIICTMGPNTDNRQIMYDLVKNGMDVARFNFSHGDYEEQKARMDLLLSLIHIYAGEKCMLGSVTDTINIFHKESIYIGKSLCYTLMV